MLDPIYRQPVSQQLIDTQGAPVVRGETLKGVDDGSGSYVALEGKALELIENVGRSTTVRIERFTELEAVDFTHTIEHYAVLPNAKVPGSDASVSVLWNGLLASKRAMVIEGWSPRASSKPSILVIWANDEGLQANLLAFEYEHNDLPTFKPTHNPAVGEMFATATASRYLPTFDPGDYQDTHAQARQQAIDLALSGKPIEDGVPVAPKPSAPDLMAALEASLAQHESTNSAQSTKPKKAKSKDEVPA
jgi:non-homologous end joining protein Ku